MELGAGFGVYKTMYLLARSLKEELP